MFEWTYCVIDAAIVAATPGDNAQAPRPPKSTYRHTTEPERVRLLFFQHGKLRLYSIACRRGRGGTSWDALTGRGHRVG